MNINTDKIKECSKKIDFLIQQYLDNYNNLFHEIDLIESSWSINDYYCKKFLDLMPFEKKDTMNMIDNIKKYNNYYKNLAESYDNFEDYR